MKHLRHLSTESGTTSAAAAARTFPTGDHNIEWGSPARGHAATLTKRRSKGGLADSNLVVSGGRSGTLTESTGTTVGKISNAACDDAVTFNIEAGIVKEQKRNFFYKKWNNNWNNKIADGTIKEEDGSIHKPQEKPQAPKESTGCCCKGSDPREKHDNSRDKKQEISADVDLPSQTGLPKFNLHPVPSHSLRAVFAREYKVFWSKLVKRFGRTDGTGRGDELGNDGSGPTDADLVTARHLYEAIPSIKETDLCIAKINGERLLLGKGNNGAVVIAFYNGPRRDIPEGVALKIFFRSSLTSVRKEALLSALAAKAGYAPRVYGIVYLKRIDAHALISEFIPKYKDGKTGAEAWTLRTLIKDEKDNPSLSASELFKLCLRMADGLQAIHDQQLCQISRLTTFFFSIMSKD